MRKPRYLRMLAATGVGTLTLLGFASTTPAFADTIGQQKTHAEAAINQRLVDLHTASSIIADTGWLGADKGALNGIVNHTVAGLAALKVTIAAQTNPTLLQQEIESIYTSYRVYAVVLPQVHLVRGSDLVTAEVLPTLQQSNTDLEAAIAIEAREGKDVAAAQAEDANLQLQISHITTATVGLSGQVLAVTPAAYDANHAVLDPARHQLGAAAVDISVANSDIAQALKDLA
jgi:hypothetical protein